VQVRLGRADFLGTAQSQTASLALPRAIEPCRTGGDVHDRLRQHLSPSLPGSTAASSTSWTPTAAGIGVWPATAWGSSSPSPGRPRCRSDR